jgi:di/tripeptidase
MLARTGAIDPAAAQSIWTEFVRLAELDTRPDPLIGYVDGEGVKYRGANDEIKFLTKKNFLRRMARDR